MKPLRNAGGVSGTSRKGPKHERHPGTRCLMWLLAPALLSTCLHAQDAIWNGSPYQMLMLATFRLEGESGPCGTAFIVGVPRESVPGETATVLVTAAHVIESMPGEYAYLFLRAKRTRSIYDTVRFRLRIRNDLTPLWTRHRNRAVDVAVMPLQAPRNLIPMRLDFELLASEKDFDAYGVGPGDEVMTVGYPYRIGCDNGDFPILRSGRIASYPVLPVKSNGIFYYDFEVYPGNSGGPVFTSPVERVFWSDIPAEDVLSDTRSTMIVGLVSEAMTVSETTRGIREVRTTVYPLGFGIVVASPFIRETIDLLMQQTRR